MAEEQEEQAGSVTPETFSVAAAWARWGWEVGHGNVRKMEAGKKERLERCAKNVESNHRRRPEEVLKQGGIQLSLCLERLTGVSG